MANDRLGRTALMYSCADGDLAQFTRLLAAAEDLNAQDRNGWTALHFATMLDDRSIAAGMTAALLASGAEADIPDANGNTPLNNAVFKAQRDYEIVGLLLKSGAKPQLANLHGVSPLSLAVSMGDAGLVDLLSS